MILFSERINGMYRDVRAAIPERNRQVIVDLLKPQLDGGADIIDINVGPSKGDPVENFVWLASVVREVTDKPLSLDSAKPDVLVQAVPRIGGKLVINSSTADPACMGKLIPLAAQHKTGIIGLTMDKEGVPGNVEKRIECGAAFIMTALEAGIPASDLYIDPIILPVNVAAKQVQNVLEAIRQLKVVNDPPPHFIIGLSNVSQKCLKNHLINRTCLVMAAAAGLDAVILDAGDRDLVEAVLTAEILLEKQLYSDDYIKAWRMQKGLPQG
jgi:5-methyltetrahydrofolate corrinoid/iron sulfur protein methyltransferase